MRPCIKNKNKQDSIGHWEKERKKERVNEWKGREYGRGAHWDVFGAGGWKEEVRSGCGQDTLDACMKLLNTEFIKYPNSDTLPNQKTNNKQHQISKQTNLSEGRGNGSAGTAPAESGFQHTEQTGALQPPRGLCGCYSSFSRCSAQGSTPSRDWYSVNATET